MQLICVPSSACEKQIAHYSIADLVERLQNSVVNISTIMKGSEHEKFMDFVTVFPYGSPFNDFSNKLFRENNNGSRKQRMVSRGSGFIVDSSGVIVTNHHVVEGAEVITVSLRDGTEFEAKLIGKDMKLDLAVLRINPKAKPGVMLTSIKWGDSEKVRVGDWVIAMGSPLGLKGSVSVGVVSARNRFIETGEYDNFLQIDASINQGSSGGPLFSMSGEVIGVNTAIMSRAGAATGFAFAQSSNTISPAVPQLIKHGEVRRGWLGVMLQPVTEDLASALGLQRSKGALVVSVFDDAPAENAGILRGDLILQFDGHEITSLPMLTRIVANTKAGTKVPVVVWRDGKTFTFSVKISRRKDGEKKLVASDKAWFLGEKATRTGKVLPGTGLRLGHSDLDIAKSKCKLSRDKAVVVLEVFPNSEAQEEGFSRGDIILNVNKKPVFTVEEVELAIKEARSRRDRSEESVLMLVLKAGKHCVPRFIALDIDDE